ncbi:hypothetical protein VTO42DRAFT_5969 [Malbranchea cinnamomea]
MRIHTGDPKIGADYGVHSTRVTNLVTQNCQAGAHPRGSQSSLRQGQSCLHAEIIESSGTRSTSGCVQPGHVHRRLKVTLEVAASGKPQRKQRKRHGLTAIRLNSNLRGQAGSAGHRQSDFCEPRRNALGPKQAETLGKFLLEVRLFYFFFLDFL